MAEAFIPLREFICAECGQCVVQVAGPACGICATCIALPGWFRDPDIAKVLDPNGHRNPPPHEL